VTGPALAAITLGAHGGGVAVVSRLVWRALRSRWGDAATLVQLLSEDDASLSLESTTLDRMKFGTRLALEQAMGRSSWIFYSHPAVAQVQRFVPPRLRRPYAVFIHGIEVWRPLTIAQHAVLAGAALRLANSAHTADRVRELHPSIGPIEACPLALPDDERAHRPAPALPVAVGTHAVIIVARVDAGERYKGHDALLDAWPAVRQRVADAQLLVVGDGDDLSRLRAKAATLGLADAVVFTGFVDAPVREALYEKAAVFAMPSRGEGFGLAYLEAMSHGLPCIASTHDAAGEIVSDEVTGFLVDQMDTAALADRIVRLLVDADLRAAMGERGRARVGREFTEAAFSARLLAHLDRGMPAGMPQPASLAGPGA
jgi:phosphatidylinositol alpha-1,6-mannosyltransferase